MSKGGYRWGDYARAFASITSRYQIEMYEYASRQLMGSVIDCGCGTGKIMPYLIENSQVTSYFGVDSSKRMVVQARKLIKKLQVPTFNVCHQTIESTRGTFSSAVSLQSYYSWPDAQKTLSCIHSLLKPDGVLILASVNEKLDICRLLMKASKELLMHDSWGLYERKNLEFTQLPETRLTTLDELIGDVRSVGFKVINAKTDLFEGGLNLLELKK